MYEIALIRGDGIGPEITDSAMQVIEALGVEVRWRELLAGEEAQRRTGSPLPRETLEEIRRIGVALKAPLAAPRCSGGVIIEHDGIQRRYPSVNNALRRELGLFVNVRPLRGWPRVSGAYAGLDLVILREITEDIYSGLERSLNGDSAEAIKRVTRTATERLARYACDFALRHGRRRICAVHKANVLHLTDGLFLNVVREIVSRHAELEFQESAVDAICYWLVKEPQNFEVLVCPNQYGDILSDLGAALVGSLGLAPGANIGHEAAVFEAAHGTAPDVAGRGVANPLALILSAGMMLEHLGENAAAGRLRSAVARLLERADFLTPDLGGHGTTASLTRALCRLIVEVP